MLPTYIYVPFEIFNDVEGASRTTLLAGFQLTIGQTEREEEQRWREERMKINVALIREA